MTGILRALVRAAFMLCAIAPVAANAQAPTQTRESAARFLDLFASQQQPPMTASVRFDQLDVDRRLRMAVPATKWVQIVADNPKRPCRIDLKDSAGQTALIDWGKAKVYFHTRADWSEAMLASAYGPLIKPMIEIRRNTGTTSYVIWPADEGQGARLYKAMQFLVDSCDPMKETGF